MAFKKGTSGNPIGRPKGSVSTTSKLIREHISQAIDGNKIMEMLDKIESPTEYINAVTKLLPYSIGKVKPYEEIEEIEHREIKITTLSKRKGVIDHDPFEGYVFILNTFIH